jgi:hypothetical protein
MRSRRIFEDEDEEEECTLLACLLESAPIKSLSQTLIAIHI